MKNESLQCATPLSKVRTYLSLAVFALSVGVGLLAVRPAAAADYTAYTQTSSTASWIAAGNWGAFNTSFSWGSAAGKYPKTLTYQIKADSNCSVDVKVCANVPGNSTDCSSWHDVDVTASYVEQTITWTSCDNDCKPINGTTYYWNFGVQNNTCSGLLIASSSSSVVSNVYSGGDVNKDQYGIFTFTDGYGPVCGDSVIEGDEECDDGGTSESDGCSELCYVEEGWWCEGEPSVCETNIYDIIEDPYSYAYNLTFTTHAPAVCHVHSGLTSPPSGGYVAETTAASTDHDITVYPASLKAYLDPETKYYYEIHCGDDESDIGDLTTLAAPADGRGAPVSTIEAPDPAQTFPSPDDPVALVAWVDIDKVAYPDTEVVFDIEITLDDVLFWSRGDVLANTMITVEGTPYWAVIKELTASFIEGEEYEVRTRARAEGYDVGAWTDYVTFDFGGTPLEELLIEDDVDFCTAPDGVLAFMICKADEWAGLLFVPSTASIAFFTSATDGWQDDAGVWTAIMGVMDDEDEYCPLPTYTAVKFGYSGDIGTMPSYDLCDKIEEAAEELWDISAFDIGMRGLAAVFSLMILVALFKWIIEG